MINIAVCEDDEKVIAGIERCVCDVFSQSNKAYNLKVFKSYGTFSFRLSDDDYSIVFLGTDVGNESGLAFARKLRQQSHCEIIVVSDTAKYALASYDINAFYYFIKPIAAEKCSFVLQRLLSKLGKANEKTVTLKRGIKYHSLPICDIESVTSDAHRIEVFLRNGEMMEFLMKLDDFVALLDDAPQFIRIHKSHIINADYIKSMDTKQADLGNRILGVSRAFKNDAVKAYSKYIQER